MYNNNNINNTNDNNKHKAVGRRVHRAARPRRPGAVGCGQFSCLILYHILLITMLCTSNDNENSNDNNCYDDNTSYNHYSYNHNG